MDLTENIENIDCLEEAVSTLLQTSKEIAEENEWLLQAHAQRYAQECTSTL